MIDDALKLTVDTVFKKKTLISSISEHPADISLIKEKDWRYPVEGYLNQENMWECILNLN